MVFTWNKTGAWQIYELDLSQPDRIQALTEEAGFKTAPAYSPDGRWLAYLRDEDGSESYELGLVDLQTHLVINLLPAQDYALQPHLAWSPDGKQLAILADRRGRFCTYCLEIDPAEIALGRLPEPRLVFDRDGPHWEAGWSPNGRWLAVLAESRAQENTLHLVSTGFASSVHGAIKLTYQDVPLNVSGYAWSPDSARIAVSAESYAGFEIGLLHLSNHSLEWLPSVPGDKHSPHWSPDGSRLAYIVQRGPDTFLAVQRIAPQVREPVLSQVQPGVHASPVFSNDSRKVYFTFNNPHHPEDIWEFDLEQSVFTQLTHSQPAREESAGQFRFEQIRYPASDGKDVPALLFTPQARTHPGKALIVLHGGPNWMCQFAWMPLMRVFAEGGIVVLAPNYRGSTGYGAAWQNANHMDMGGKDAEDVAAGAQELIRRGLAEKGAIALTGRSYGGYLTLVCLTRFPELWAAGSAVAAFANWFTCFDNSRPDLQHWDIENMGNPKEQAALWRERSPFFYLDRIQVPLQLISGATDIRCPSSEAAAVRDALLALGKEVECLVYPDEGHVFSQHRNILDSGQRLVEFLAAHLMV